MNDWDKLFLDLAERISRKSKDPSTKVGAVITRDNVLVSIGYNGFARQTSDRKDWLENRELKYRRIIHAEINSLIFAEQTLEDCTVYTYPFQPCAPCTSILIQAGVTRIVAPINDNPRWVADFAIAKETIDDAGIILDLFDYPIHTELKIYPI